MALADTLDALRRPEYTGANRCWPCTAVNATIAGVVAVTMAVAVPLDATGSVAVGGVALAVFGAAIALRGYLVPGTPQVTEAYLPDRLLRYFDHHERPPSATGDVDPAAVLADAGAVTECEHVDDLCLTDEFRAAWDARIDERRDADTSRADLAAVIDVPEAALTVEEHGDAFVALVDGTALDRPAAGVKQPVGQWESRGAFLADMAAAGVLRERYPGWSRLAADARGQVLNGLRLFLERCPTCGGDLRLGEETVESCCRSMDVVAVTCEACDARLFEAEQPAAA